MSDAIFSVREPHIVTMDMLWWEVAAELGKPRSFFKDKLRLMRFVLGKPALCLYAPDGDEEAASMAASMHAMNLPIWNVMYMPIEEV